MSDYLNKSRRLVLMSTTAIAYWPPLKQERLFSTGVAELAVQRVV